MGLADTVLGNIEKVDEVSKELLSAKEDFKKELAGLLSPVKKLLKELKSDSSKDKSQSKEAFKKLDKAWDDMLGVTLMLDKLKEG